MSMLESRLPKYFFINIEVYLFYTVYVVAQKAYNYIRLTEHMPNMDSVYLSLELISRTLFTPPKLVPIVDILFLNGQKRHIRK